MDGGEKFVSKMLAKPRLGVGCRNGSGGVVVSLLALV